jgi:hypothetical protein
LYESKMMVSSRFLETAYKSYVPQSRQGEVVYIVGSTHNNVKISSCWFLKKNQ